jgi:hypothetical protein
VVEATAAVVNMGLEKRDNEDRDGALKNPNLKRVTKGHNPKVGN